MPKKTKNKSLTPASSSPAPAPVSPPKKRAVAPKSAAKKKTAPGAAKKIAGKPASKVKAKQGPSDNDIQLRAYFIAERRMQFALPGDSAHDWLEARRQLTEEASQVR